MFYIGNPYPASAGSHYLAWEIWRDESAFAVDGGVARTSAPGLVVKAFLLNILNPKLTIFFLAFLPQFVHPAAGRPLLRHGFAAVFAGLGLKLALADK